VHRNTFRPPLAGAAAICIKLIAVIKTHAIAEEVRHEPAK
jgi:hypothetical protein